MKSLMSDTYSQTILYTTILTFSSTIISNLSPKVFDIIKLIIYKIYDIVIWIANVCYRKFKRQRTKPSIITSIIYRTYTRSDYKSYAYGCLSNNFDAIVWYLNKLNLNSAKLIQTSTLPMCNIDSVLPVTQIIIFRRSSDNVTNLDLCVKNITHIYDGDIIIDITLKTDSAETIFDEQCFIVMQISSYTKTKKDLLSYIKNIERSFKLEGNTTNDICILMPRFVNDQMYCETYDVDKSQTFKNLFMDQKKMIINEIDNLRNIKYYTDFGQKRKLSYLFVGKPGTGKTSLVSAIANYTKRNIIYVNLNNIKKNIDLLEIMYNNKFNGNYYNNNKIILLFDEIDKTKIFNERKTETEKIIYIGTSEKDKKIIDDNKNENDEFNVGQFLSMLDGIFNQDGLIIIATANNIDNINPAFYRDGRLRLVNIDYIGNNEIKEIIETYSGKHINDKLFSKIRNDKVIQTLTIKNICINCIRNGGTIEQIITTINNIKPI